MLSIDFVGEIKQLGFEKLPNLTLRQLIKECQTRGITMSETLIEAFSLELPCTNEQGDLSRKGVRVDQFSGQTITLPDLSALLLEGAYRPLLPAELFQALLSGKLGLKMREWSARELLLPLSQELAISCNMPKETNLIFLNLLSASEWGEKRVVKTPVTTRSSVREQAWRGEPKGGRHNGMRRIPKK